MAPQELDPEEIKIFLEELDELTQILEEDIVKIEKYPDDPSLIAEVFRAAHTIKGSSATMGFTTLSKLTHAMENVFASVRSGTLGISVNLVTTFLQCTDFLRGVREEIARSGEVISDTSALLVDLERINLEKTPATDAKHSPADHVSAVPAPPAAPAPQGGKILVRVDAEKQCLMPFARAFQALSFLSQVGEVVKSTPTVGEIEREKRAFPLQVILATSMSEDSVRAILDMVSEIIILEIRAVDDAEADRTETAKESKPEPEEKPAFKPELAAKPEPKQEMKPKPEEEPKPKAKAEPAPEPEPAPKPEPAAVAETKEEPDSGKAKGLAAPVLPAADADPKAPKPKQPAQSVRIDIDRVDAIVDLVGELVINRTRLIQLSRDLESSHENDETVKQLNETSDRIELITTLLQEQVMRTRLFPLESVFQRFPRMVRDLANKSGKQIELVISGEKTELDRSVLEEIGDPLMHILRNSIDHGIEEPEERAKTGKPSAGQIRISANHVEDNIMIVVEDDGRGIDAAKVMKKARAVRLAPDKMLDRLTERDVLNLVFLPGFSTRDTVSEVSGRGVGMDVVRNNIEKLSGSVVLDSVPGRGTRISIRLPLTLAIIRSLLITAGSRIYAIPLNSVVQTLRIDRDQVRLVKGAETIVFRGGVMPIFKLEDVFQMRHDDRERKRMFVVVVAWGGKKLGLIVDALIGDQEIVIRPLGEYIGEIPAVSGATILGDGRIALIVDVGGIVKRQPGEIESVVHGDYLA